MNKLKLLFAGIDSHINKIYSAFHTLKDFYTILQQRGETVKNIFAVLKLNDLTRNCPKETLLKTNHWIKRYWLWEQYKPG